MGGGGHSDDEGTPYDQRLEEVEFMRSACAAAQRGDLDKLRATLLRRPGAALEDGAGGASGYTPFTTPLARVSSRASSSSSAPAPT